MDNIEIWSLFGELLKQCNKIVLMDGALPNRSLHIASSYGHIVYAKSKSDRTSKLFNLICDPATWEAQLHEDLENFYKDDRVFRIRIASQSSAQALSI